MTLIKSYQLVSKTEEIMPGNLKITTVYNCFIEKYPCYHLKEDSAGISSIETCTYTDCTRYLILLSCFVLIFWRLYLIAASKKTEKKGGKADAGKDQVAHVKRLFVCVQMKF